MTDHEMLMELLEEKRRLESEQAELVEWQRIADEYEGLQKDHRSARAALMSYAEIREAVVAGGELVESAEAELAAMTERRKCVDELEKVLPDELWPVPKYREMLFIM